MTKYRFSVCTMVMLASVSIEASESQFLGENLLTQGGFEEWSGETPEGWTVNGKGNETCEPDDAVYVQGTRSVKLHLPVGLGEIELTTHPIPVKEGQYFVRFIFRASGLTNKGEKTVVAAAGVNIHWLGEGQQVLRTDEVGYTCFPLGWTYRNRLYQTPPGTIAFRISGALKVYNKQEVEVPSTVWFDDIAVCAYYPPVDIGNTVLKEWSVVDAKEILKVPGTKAWFYPMEGYESVHGERVKDSNAVYGWAMHAKLGVPRGTDGYSGIVWHGQCLYEHPIGLYRVFLRIKASIETKVKPGNQLAYVDLVSGDYSTRAERIITLNDFKQSGEYEDIFLFDFIKRSSNYIGLRIFTPGEESEFWLDHIRIVELKHFADDDLLEWFPGFTSSIGSNPTLESDKNIKFLIVEGLFAYKYRLNEAVQNIPDCEVDRVFYNISYMGGSIENFPTSWENLSQYRVVILANAGIKALGVEQRFQLHEFVRLGGGLLILGGKATYGSGGFRGSFLEEVLPIEITNNMFDIKRSQNLLVKTDSQLFGSIPWSKELICPYIHQTVARENAVVAVSAGKEPFIITGIFGKGRVVCITCTPYGTVPAGKIAFSEWKDWPLLMKNIFLWLSQSEGGLKK